MVDVALSKRQEEASRMQMVLEQWQRSGLSKTDCCKTHGVTVSKFYDWFKKYQKRQAQIPFTELQVEAGITESVISVPSSSIPSSAQPVSKDPVMELQLSAGRRIVFYEPVSTDYLKSLLS